MVWLARELGPVCAPYEKFVFQVPAPLPSFDRLSELNSSSNVMWSFELSMPY